MLNVCTFPQINFLLQPNIKILVPHNDHKIVFNIERSKTCLFHMHTFAFEILQKNFTYIVSLFSCLLRSLSKIIVVYFVCHFPTIRKIESPLISRSSSHKKLFRLRKKRTRRKSPRVHSRRKK